MKYLRYLSVRANVVALFFGVAFLAVFIKLLTLVALPNYSMITRTIPQVERGAIYDRNGALLAEEVETFTISLWLPDVQERGVTESDAERDLRVKKTAEALAPIVLWPQDELYDRILELKGPRSLVLMKKAPANLKEKATAAVRAGALRGLRVDRTFSRAYPNGDLAANLLGYVNYDNRGGDGLEYAYEKILEPASLGKNESVVDGNAITLTIDANLQAIIQEELGDAMLENKAESATTLLMDAKTGEILAYVSLPDYDPNFYNLASPDQLSNRPVAQTYEPGSVFKVFSISSLLDAGAITPHSEFFCPGFYEHITASGERIVINCLGKHGHELPVDILANSCNAGTAYASDLMGRTQFYEKLSGYGFGKKTGVPLAGETSGIFATPVKWSARSKPTIAMGQEIGVSAMQIVQAATAITNGGMLLKPLVVSRVVSPEGVVLKRYGKTSVREAISPTTASLMLDMLEKGVERGIARLIHIDGLDIAAKTGTSQTYDPVTGTYSVDSYIASMLAMFPAKNPKYILYMALHKPMGKSYYGANIVAPVLKRMIKRIVPFSATPMAGTRVFESPMRVDVASPRYDLTGETLPDFTKGSLRGAMAFLNGKGVAFASEGTGDSIVDQFPPAGALITPDLTVRLELGSARK